LDFLTFIAKFDSNFQLIEKADGIFLEMSVGNAWLNQQGNKTDLNTQ